MISRLYDYFFKNNQFIFPELWPFENLGILNLSARYLEHYLSWGLETWSADRGWCVDYLLNVWAKSKVFGGITTLQIRPYLGSSKCWGHSVLQTPALVKSIFCFYSEICLFAFWYILSITVARVCLVVPIFPLDFFFRFSWVVNFKENYFQFKKYTIFNFLIC